MNKAEWRIRRRNIREGRENEKEEEEETHKKDKNIQHVYG